MAKYLDLDGLTRYDGKIKNYVSDGLSTKQNTLTTGDNITISGDTISATDTTYESLTAVSGGTALSLCTTGEKYLWNNKQDSMTAISNAEIDSLFA